MGRGRFSILAFAIAFRNACCGSYTFAFLAGLRLRIFRNLCCTIITSPCPSRSAPSGVPLRRPFHHPDLADFFLLRARFSAGTLSTPLRAGQSHMRVDPHSDLLRKPPLPRSTGERKHRPQGLAPFLYLTKVGERWPAKRDGVGVIRPYAIALPLREK
jgi:hypothetical protein